MTTDTKALIAEALARRDALLAAAKPHHADLAAGLLDDADLLRRLAAALDEATPPEGWRVTELSKGSDRVVFLDGEEWTASQYSVEHAEWKPAAKAFGAFRDAIKALEDGKHE